MPPKFKFQEGEKILCDHGAMIYEAKCLKAEKKGKQKQYYIHYAGWKKSYDEWVPEARVLKHNEANVLKQVELMEIDKKAKQHAKMMKLLRKNGKTLGKVGKASATSSTAQPSLSTSVIDLTVKEPVVGRMRGEIVDKAMFDELYGQREFLRNLDKEYIDEMFEKYKGVIHDIFRDLVDSERNNEYKVGWEARRNMILIIEVEEVHQVIIYHILERMVYTFTPDHPCSHQDYLWKVSLPEFMIRVFMDKYGFSYDAAVQRFKDIYHFTVSGEVKDDHSVMRIKI